MLYCYKTLTYVLHTKSYEIFVQVRICVHLHNRISSNKIYVDTTCTCVYDSSEIMYVYMYTHDRIKYMYKYKYANVYTC